MPKNRCFFYVFSKKIKNFKNKKRKLGNKVVYKGSDDF